MINKKLQQIINRAMDYAKQNNINNFVVVENIDKNYVKQYKTDTRYDIEFFEIFFNDFFEIENLMAKKLAYDYIDNCYKLNENEKIIYIYSKNKIVIM